ncbi:MAG: hypothetical protein J6331_08990, partial [Lentisphaeria bacterium]|nr:hypothetical protein [Lentisphaeria bacterium]
MYGTCGVQAGELQKYGQDGRLVKSAAVSVIDTSTRTVRLILLPNGSTGVRGVGASPDGKSVYVTHT